MNGSLNRMGRMMDRANPKTTMKSVNEKSGEEGDCNSDFKKVDEGERPFTAGLQNTSSITGTEVR
jgi:hypothetical protein